MPCRSSHLAHQHWRCQRGNVSIVFGLMFVVMMTAIGAAVDIGRALSAQSHLQGLLDAAVLTAAAKSRTVGSNAQQDGATAFMHTWNGRHGAATPELSFTREDGGVFKASARSSVPTSIVQLIGIPRIEILGEAHVKSKSQTAEIALVMDNTFSMSGSKITTLKRSARSYGRILVMAAGDQAAALG